MAGETNLRRMFGIIDEVFSTRNDPDQLQVTPDQQAKLSAIHPSTLSEISDENGPVVWILMIPTTEPVKRDFLKGIISEKELLERTVPGDKYDSVYLCSATTLPEYRGKGMTKKLCLEAIRKISEKHPLQSLFVWPFTQAGEKLAEAVARESGLRLYKRTQVNTGKG